MTYLRPSARFGPSAAGRLDVYQDLDDVEPCGLCGCPRKRTATPSGVRIFHDPLDGAVLVEDCDTAAVRGVGQPWRRSP